jgi:tellurite methyltransferase
MEASEMRNNEVAAGWKWEELDEANRVRWLIPSPEVARLAQELAPPAGKRVYDLGCGIGRHTLYLAQAGFEVYASDVAPEAIAQARQLLAQHGCSAEFRTCDMTEPIAPDDFFHGAVAFHVIYHALPERVEAAVANLRRMLRPKGLLFLTLKSTAGSDYGRGEQIAPNTFVFGGGFDTHLPHYFVDEAGARRLLSAFTLESLAHEVRTEYHADAATRIRAHWFAVCRK